MPEYIGAAAIGIVIAIVALVGAVVLGRVVVKGGGPRTALWLILLALAAVVATLAAQVATVYYTLPIAWIIALVVIVAATIALFVRVGMDIKWKTGGMIALVGVLITANAVLVAVMMVTPLGTLLVPIFETRAQQTGAAFGFTTLLPPDEEMFTEYRPVNTIEGPDKGVSILYKQFEIQERKAPGPLSESELRTILAPGVDPLGIGGPGIPGDARYTSLEVQGNPALGVEYVLPAEKAIGGGVPETVHVLIFERDGVEVRLFARNGATYQPDGSYEPYSALSLDRLAQIAETMVPIGR